MNSVADVWDNVLQQLKKELSETTIATWFDELEAVDIQGNVFILHCSNDFKKGYIESLFMKNIKASLHDIFSTDFEVRILDDQGYAEFQGNAPKKQSERFTSAEFTFETFVVGPSNKLAYAASVSVAEHPAQNYNPLLIYGDSGLGKTHLLYAIAHGLKQNYPDAKVVYIKGDDFTNELVASIREGKNAEFREKYRQATLLLVDDVQFIAGKEQTQEEFFHTFNSLYEAGKQIVLTSDRPPREMTKLEDRLRTRFEWGLMVDVTPPDYETRLAIVKNKSAMLGVKLSDPVSDLIAENVTANVRQIEGTLNKILAYYDLMGSTMSQEDILKAIRDMIKKNNEYIPTAQAVVDFICSTYHIDEDVLRGQSRGREVVNARQIAMYLMRRMICMNLVDIGKEFGDRDHTTVLHSLDKVEKQMRSDPAFAETVKQITTNINNSARG